MKKIVLLLLTMSFAACAQEKAIRIAITNTSSEIRKDEIVELSTDVVKKFKQKGFIITDSKGMQVPYQITFEHKLIFPATVNPKSSALYTVSVGKPDIFKKVVCGKHYPERVDDIAWENNRIAFRTYGPALQKSGEKAYGCDIWVKCIAEPIVDFRYKLELGAQSKAKLAELNKTDKKAARQFAESVSYHNDHGNGLDYYKVGPTLGAGTTALMKGDSIVYPYCYNTYKILDNGPLRFTVKLTYNPLIVGNNSNIIETRIITLDYGSQLNKVTVSYANLTKPTPILTGIVIHAPSLDLQADAEAGYISYADPIDPVNGQIFVGAVFTNKLESAKPILFSAKEKAERDAEGHVAAISLYTPGTKYIYYAGAGWSKYGFKDSTEWNRYVRTFAKHLKQPLKIKIAKQ
ncbi:MAG: DUF4861 domain-containing protein [Parabacteroides sp.]|nr:DUF4861 domain-containing protein [Parabacteroides sp.]